jgi:hypothetical protein
MPSPEKPKKAKSARKKLSCFLFILLTVPYQVNQHSKTDTKGAGAQNKVEQLSPPPRADNTYIFVAEPHSQNDQSNGQNKHHWYQSLSVQDVTAIAIAVFAFLTLLVMREQLRYTKVSERAWVVPVIRDLQETRKTDEFQAECALTNTGKSPAWITDAGSCALYLNPQDKIPENPSFTKMGPFPKEGGLLAPGGMVLQGVPVTQTKIDHVLEKDKVYYFLGFVKYRGLDNKKVIHETFYCFQLAKAQNQTLPVPVEFYVSGPPAFNRAD